MANYVVTYAVTSIGTHAEVQAELETLVEAIDTTKTIHLIGISELSRDRDRCIGYALFDEILATQGATHVHTAPNLTITTNP
jgi:hypothetical protein